MQRWRSVAALLAISVFAAACTSEPPATIGSIEVDRSALVWGEQSLEETFAVLTELQGPTDDLNAVVARVGPFVELPDFPDVTVEGVDIDLPSAVTVWFTTSLSPSDIQSQLMASPNFPSLEADLGSEGLDQAFTTTSTGASAMIDVELEGDRSLVEIAHAAGLNEGEFDFESGTRAWTPLISPDATMPNVLLSTRGSISAFIVMFNTPGATEDEVRQANIDRLLEASWTPDDEGNFRLRTGDQDLTAWFTVRPFREEYRTSVTVVNQEVRPFPEDFDE